MATSISDIKRALITELSEREELTPADIINYEQQLIDRLLLAADTTDTEELVEVEWLALCV